MPEQNQRDAQRPPHTAHGLRRTLAQNVRAERERQEQSQEQLAEAAGLTQQYLSDVERAKRNVSVDAIGRLADALHVKASRLFD